MEALSVQRILEEYQLPIEADDTTVSRALMAAGWHETDVAAFLRVRAGLDTTLTQRTTLHKLMGVDHRLHPDTITAVLNVSLTVDSLTQPKPDKWYAFSLRTIMTVIGVACVGALIVMLLCLWWMELGWFHPFLR